MRGFRLNMIAQMAWGVNEKEKILHTWDPQGIITTYWEYPKPIVVNSYPQPLAQNQADKFL